NEGDADAESVVITDTMQGMTYIADTSGLPSTGSGTPGEPLVWDLGTLPPETQVQFEVFVQLTASASDTITNTAEIATSNPYDMGDPEEKVSEWVGHVIPNDTHLNLGKDAWTGDPAPGHEFVWAVNLCNNGGTASSQVTLTDTLPISTTLLGWWSQHPGWSEVSKDAAQLVVSRPSIPGWWCSEVYLNLLLDPNAWHGMSISNTATIYASNDIESDDNYTEHWIQVSQPHTNLGVDKWWNWGQLVPGGEASYAVDAYNNGNVPVSGVTLTDTLPVSTTLIGIWAYDRNWNYLTEVTPVLYDGEIVVWELESIENGTHLNYEIQLAFDPEAVPGTQMLNTIEISPQPDEDDYSDNEDQWLETLFDHGPNLRIRKDGSWDDWGEETRRASYWLNVENVGDVRVENFTITDTYDSKMYLEGEINTEEWRLLNWSDNPASHYFTATFEGLDPGEGTWINFSTITDTSPLPLGLIFTNTAEVSLTPDDTNPDDNVGQKILTTGPDLSIEKSLVAGEVLPGELITFSLDFSNDRPGHEWWWNMQGEALITDTLPSGLEYITSSLSWCGWIEQEWCSFPANVEDNKLGWHMWPFSSGEMYEIQLTVRVTETALGGDTFTNWVEIASTDPVSDTEPYYDNNTESQDVVVPLPNFEVDKVYESSQVAGTLVTYTLTVTNTGFEAGTNVLLSDTLPSVLTYGGGNGTFDGTDVTWNFASIAPNGGTATGWFWATLPCAGQVINEEYRVVSSDQGVDGAQGTPVSFDVLTPTITANVDVSPPYIVAGDLVDFSAQASTDGSTLTEFEWDFGDGSTGTGLSTSHTYTQDDDYTVVFTATDTCDYSTIVETPIVVHPPNLLADFQQSATLASIGEMLYFTDTSTTDGLPISTWEWDFGDGGTPVYTQKAVHTYAEEGQFTVSLTVTDSLGYSDIIVVEDAVTVEKSISEIYLPLIRLDDSGTGSVK
ncbi:MAG: PKD domain-containing protein, partial [Anaerolineales bacterium]